MKDPHEKKKFQCEWMQSDWKPKGKVLKKIRHSGRQNAKRQIKKEVDNGRTE